MSFYSSIFTTVDSATASYVGNTVTNITLELAPIFKLCFTIYIIMWGFSVYRGLIQEAVMDGVFRLIRIAIIMQLALKSGEYNTLIATNILNMPDYLIGLIGNSGTSGTAKASLDTILASSMAVGNEFWKRASIIPPGANPGFYIMAIIVWISSILTTAYAAFLIILSKLALSVMLGLGPIFILLLMFESTKKFFEAWVGQIVNYALISGITVAVLKLLFGMYAQVANDTIAAVASSSGDFSSITTLLILSVICSLVLAQVLGMASSIAGGVSLSTLGAGAWAMRKGMAGMGAMRPSNIQKSMRGAKKDYAVAKAGLQAPYKWAKNRVSSKNSVSKAA